MSELTPETLEKKLSQRLGEAISQGACHDIHSAMDLAHILEDRGFSFQLKDLCPKKMYESAWRAVFVKGGVTFAAEDPEAPVAVCRAATEALDQAT